MRTCVSAYFMCSDSIIMSTVAVCLKDTMRTLDIHTHCDMDIYFCCFRVRICYHQFYHFFSSFRYCWVFVVFSAALGRDLGLQVSPKSRQQKVLSAAEFALWERGAEGGRGLVSSELAVHIFTLCDWLLDPSKCWPSPPPPPLYHHHLQCRCFSDCNPFFFFFFFFFSEFFFQIIISPCGPANTDRLFC